MNYRLCCLVYKKIIDSILTYSDSQLVMAFPRLHKAAVDGNIDLVRQFHSDGVNEKAYWGEMIIILNL